MTDITINPPIIVSIKGRYCSGCAYMGHNYCQLFSKRLKTGMYILRDKLCIIAEKALTKK